MTYPKVRRHNGNSPSVKVPCIHLNVELARLWDIARGGRKIAISPSKRKKPLKSIGRVLKEGLFNISGQFPGLRILRQLRKSILNLFSTIKSPNIHQNEKLSFSTFETVSSSLNRMRRLPLVYHENRWCLTENMGLNQNPIFGLQRWNWSKIDF